MACASLDNACKQREAMAIDASRRAFYTTLNNAPTNTSSAVAWAYIQAQDAAARANAAAKVEADIAAAYAVSANQAFTAQQSEMAALARLAIEKYVAASPAYISKDKRFTLEGLAILPAENFEDLITIYKENGLSAAGEAWVRTAVLQPALDKAASIAVSKAVIKTEEANLANWVAHLRTLGFSNPAQKTDADWAYVLNWALINAKYLPTVGALDSSGISTAPQNSATYLAQRDADLRKLASTPSQFTNTAAFDARFKTLDEVLNRRSLHSSKISIILEAVQRIRSNTSFINIWPYPNIPYEDRAAVSSEKCWWPMSFAYRLDGTPLNSSAEYRAYWYNLPEMSVAEYGFYGQYLNDGWSNSASGIINGSPLFESLVLQSGEFRKTLEKVNKFVTRTAYAKMLSGLKIKANPIAVTEPHRPAYIHETDLDRTASMLGMKGTTLQPIYPLGNMLAGNQTCTYWDNKKSVWKSVRGRMSSQTVGTNGVICPPYYEVKSDITFSHYDNSGVATEFRYSYNYPSVAPLKTLLSATALGNADDEWNQNYSRISSNQPALDFNRYNDFTLAKASLVALGIYELTNEQMLHYQDLYTRLRMGVEDEIFQRFDCPFVALPKKKVPWWKKYLGVIITVFSFVLSVVTYGISTALVGLLGSKIGSLIAEKVGGVAGTFIGAIASFATGMAGGALGFVPPPSTISPSYSFTSTIIRASPLPLTINQAIGKGLDAVIQSYIGISPEGLGKITANPLLQAFTIAAGIAAPKKINMAIGAAATVTQFSNLTTPKFDVFLPAAKTVAVAFAPQLSREIAAGYEVLKFAPQGSQIISFLGKVIPKTIEYVVENVGRLPEIAIRGAAYAIENVSQVPQLAVKATTFVMTKAPPLAVKGLTYVATEVPPLAVKGATFVMEKAPPLAVKSLTYVATEVPPLAVKGTTFVMEKAPPLAAKGITYVATEVPQLAMKGLTYVATEVPQLAMKGLTYVATEVPPLAVKGTTFVMEKAPPLAAKGITYVATEVPPLAMKGATFVMEKTADILLEGFQETGKAIIKIPELIGKGLGEATNFAINRIDDLTKLLVKAVSHLDELNIPAVSLPNLPKVNLGILHTTIVPISTVTPTGITTIQQPTPVSKGTNGESIIHLPARPIEVNPLPLLALGAAAAVLLAVAATGKKD